MSTVTSQAPSAPFPFRQHLPAELEPDKAWKDNLYKTIEDTLQSMVDDAKKDYENRLQEAVTEDTRGLAEEEYHRAMNNIRSLAKESFQAQLNRERQERLWASGQSLTPQWDRALKTEQQDIMMRIKKTSLGSTTTTNHSSVPAPSSSTRVEPPPSSSFPPRNGPTAIPAAPARPGNERSPDPSPRGPDIRNFDHPRVEPRRTQPEPTPKRRSTSIEHTMPGTPSSVTKSPLPPPSPFTSGAPFRPQDPSPTLGIAPINVVARDLPPELAARRDQYSSLSRRGSNAASQAREGYPRPGIPSFQSPKIDKLPQPPPPPAALANDDLPTDPEDESSQPTGRWATRRTSTGQDRSNDTGPSRSIERPAAYSPSDRLPARSPSNPQVWKPSMSPEEETVPPRTGNGLARRGSTASIRSTGSGSIRPNIAEPIPEHEHESVERDRDREPRRKKDSEHSRPKDLPVQGPAARPDNWPTSDPIYDEPASYSPPKPSTTSRGQDMMGPPTNPPTRPPSTRKPSYQTEDREPYQSQRLRAQASFNDDRPFPSPYTPAPPSSRPSPRTGADFYEYPRPAQRDFYAYSGPPPESPYSRDQTSATWRRAIQPESPPIRRPSENSKSGINREASYGKYRLPGGEDSPVGYDDHRYFDHPSSKYDMYEPISSAIPIRQRPSHGEDNSWRAWGGEQSLRHRSSRREVDDYAPRGFYDSRYDDWGRDDREYDRDRDDHRGGNGYDRQYHGSSSRYSSEMVHSNSRDGYGLGPRSSPSSYRNENHHRFGGREYRPSYDAEDDDDYLDNPYTRGYHEISKGVDAYYRSRRTMYGSEAAEQREELFKDIRRQSGGPRYLDPPSDEDSPLRSDDSDEDADVEEVKPRFIREKVTRVKLPVEKKTKKVDPAVKEAEERKRRAEEERRQEEEEARRQEEIETKARELVEEMRRKEEEDKRLAEEARQKEEEEARKLEEEHRKKEEIESRRREREARKKEERQRKAEEERKRKEEEERVRMEAESKRNQEEIRKEREAFRRKEEEIRRKEEEARKKEAEAKRKEEEFRRKEEEARRKEAETRRKEEEFRRKEEEARRKEEEWTRKEQEAKKKEQEAKKKERELKRKEEEAKRKEQELKRKEEEARRKEEEARRREEELEEEARRREEEARRREEELEEEARRREEEAQRKEEELRLKEEEARKREEELQKREEEFQRREDEIAARRNLRQEEFRKREEEIRRRKGEPYDPDSGWAPSSYGSASSFGSRSNRKDEEPRLTEETRRKEDEQVKKDEEERIRRETEEADRKAAEELQEQFLAEARQEEERRQRDIQQREVERKKMDEIWRQRQTEQVKRKQQEEFKKQEEQLRQQAEERKRQRSGTQEYANGFASGSFGSHYTSSSSPPWTSATSNAWGSSRTSASTFSSSFERDEGPNDWQRRQEEMHQKQQEQFRKEQERLESMRQVRGAGRIPTKAEILAIYDNHERLWSTIASKPQLLWKDFPWPMFKTPASPEEITMHTVSAYMQSPHYPETAKVKTYKDRLRDHIRRWHPDRFETQTLPRVVDDQKETVREAAGSVVRALNDLNSRANNVNDVFS